MKKSKYFFITFFMIIIASIIIYMCSYNKKDINDISNSNLSKNTNTESQVELENDDSNTINQKEEIAKNKIDSIIEDNNHSETEISTFSTDILDDSPGRLTNIRITCDILNDNIVESGQTFSFNEIVGQPSATRGYQEAPIIVDGDHETGIGGR